MRVAILLSLIVFAFSSNEANASKEVDPFLQCESTGSTTLYSLKKDEWFYTNEADSKIRTLPASTFKIFHSLIALDKAEVSIDEVFEWDGVERQFSKWNKDTKFADAFRNSTIWVYEELSQKISTSTYIQYLKWADYLGNGDIHHGENGNFWVYGKWGLSPKEQIEMLIKLNGNELPFSTSSIQNVKNLMKDGDVYGKTGWTNDEKNQIGWWIGYVERSDDTVFFATRLMKEKDKELGNFLECRKSITNTFLEKF